MTAPIHGDTWGRRLRRRREACNLTQEALADTVGVSRWTVARWESDKEKGAPEYVRAAAEAVGEDPAVAFRMLGWLPADPTAPPLVELPPEVERIMALYDGARPSERIVLLGQLIVVAEWFEARRARIAAESRIRRRTG